jgi:NAD(P)-dependent dehydrogenase (short-subunit alcohol dehydrogenase family)
MVRIENLMSDNAIVFGAAGLLGPFWARAMGAKADRVFLVGLNLETDKLVQELVTTDPGKYVIINEDLNSTPKSAICQEIGSLNYKYAVFSAGLDSVPSSDSENQDLCNFSWGTWEKYVVDNIRIFVNCLDFFCSHRTPQSFGVAIGSMYTSVTPNPNNYKVGDNPATFIKHPGYSASKNAVLAIMRQYAAHYASQGLVLNMLSPGVVENKQPNWFSDNMLPKIPKDKFLVPADLVGPLNFLTSPDASHLIGHELKVDGGYTLW